MSKSHLCEQPSPATRTDFLMDGQPSTAAGHWEPQVDQPPALWLSSIEGRTLGAVSEDAPAHHCLTSRALRRNAAGLPRASGVLGGVLLLTPWGPCFLCE